MKALLECVEQFQKSYFKENKDLFKELGNGQSPDTLFITCSDSRIDPNLLTNTKPGELFVIRNAGNLIESYNSEDPSFEAISIEFAVKALKIKSIVICGHKDCGAMVGVQNVESLGDFPLLQKKLRGLSHYLNDVSSGCINDLIQHNVEAQIKNLKSYPFVKEGIENGSLSIHGWVYDFVNGKVEVVVSEGKYD